MHALVEIPQISDYQNWEIYTDGRSCVYIDHGSRAASDTAQSLEEFKDQIKKLRGEMNIETSKSSVVCTSIGIADGTHRASVRDSILDFYAVPS